VLGRATELVGVRIGTRCLPMRTAEALGLGAREGAVLVYAATLLGERVAPLDAMPNGKRPLSDFDPGGTASVRAT